MKRFDQYIDDVLSGEIVTGEKVKQACQRHLKDLENDQLLFDRDEAQRVIDLHENFVLYEAEKAGQQMILEPFQAFIIGSVFGWWWKDEKKGRRFKYIYEEVGRKNAKSMRMAATAAICTRFDYEPAPQNFCIATNYDQAYQSFIKAFRLSITTGLVDNKKFEKPKSLKPIAMVGVGNFGFYRPLANVPSAQEGLNPYLTIVEEYHVHKDSGFYEVMKSAMGSRKNQMLWIITTAGSDMDGPCYVEHQYASDILAGIIEDDNYFAVIYAIDKDDDWNNEECWAKANPGLGTIKNLDGMRAQYLQARTNSSKRAEFRRKHLGVWGEEEDAFFDEDVINANIGEKLTAEQIEILRGQYCSTSIDAGNTRDITSLTHEFRNPFGDGRDVYIYRYFVPRGACSRDKKNAENYLKWEDEGWLTITEGVMSDNDALEEQLLNDRDKLGFDIYQIQYDPTFLKDFARRMEEDHGFEMVTFSQTYGNYTGSLIDFEKRMHQADPDDIDIIIGSYNCGGHPVTKWMLRAFRVKKRGDLMMPEKPNNPMSPRKIDGGVTMIMCEDGMADLPVEKFVQPKPRLRKDRNK